MVNKNKTAHAGSNQFTILFVDTKKHQNVPYDKTEEIQLYGNSFKGVKYQDIPRTINYQREDFSEEQLTLYRQAVYGLSIYSQDELSLLSTEDKEAIRKTHRRAQKVLNQWKQKLTVKAMDNLLLALFPNSKIVKQLKRRTKNYVNDSLTNRQTFNQLGIDKFQVAQKLIDHNILPSIFFNLKTA